MVFSANSTPHPFVYYFGIQDMEKSKEDDNENATTSQNLRRSSSRLSDFSPPNSPEANKLSSKDDESELPLPNSSENPQPNKGRSKPMPLKLDTKPFKNPIVRSPPPEDNMHQLKLPYATSAGAIQRVRNSGKLVF